MLWGMQYAVVWPHQLKDSDLGKSVMTPHSIHSMLDFRIDHVDYKIMTAGRHCFTPRRLTGDVR